MKKFRCSLVNRVLGAGLGAALLAAGLAPAGPLLPGEQPLLVHTLAGLANYGVDDGVKTNAKFVEPTGLAFDSLGNLYVADSFNGVIRKITTYGAVITLAGADQVQGIIDGAGTNAHFHSPAALAVDTNGNIYVADTGNSTIRFVTPAGVVSTLAGVPDAGPGFANGSTASNAPNAARFAYPGGIAIGPSNTLYVSDTANNVVRIISGTNVTTLAGNPTGGFSDGTGTNAFFSSPGPLVLDASNNVYVSDTGNNAIRMITPAGVVTTLSVVGGTLSSPRGILLAAPGVLYVADTTNQVVKKLTLSGTNWDATIVAGVLGSNGDGDGVIPQGLFHNPWGLAQDASGNLYVGDSLNGTVREIAASNSFVSTFAGPDRSYALQDGTGKSARFFAPGGLAVDAGSNVYVADTSNNCIRLVTPAGVVTTIAGSLTGAAGTNDGTNTTGMEFNHPTGIVLDAASNLFVSDTGNNTIRKLTANRSGPSTTWVSSTFAGQPGHAGYLDASNLAALFNSPAGLAVDSSSNLYVSDSSNNAIRIIGLTGTVSTFAGNGAAGSNNATGTNATFNYPVGLSIDSHGNLFVADTSNGLVRQVYPGAFVTTLSNFQGLHNDFGITVDPFGEIYVADTTGNVIYAGYSGGTVANEVAGSWVLGSDDGLGALAQFAAPHGLATDPSGNVYIADTANNTIRFGVPSQVGQDVLSVLTSPDGLAVTVNGSNYSNSPQSVEVVDGTTNTVSAPTNAGFVFTGWTDSDTGAALTTNSSYTFVISSNTTLVANYGAGVQVTLVSVPTNGGVLGGGGYLAEGTTTTITAQANLGYVFSSWTENGALVSSVPDFTVEVTDNVTYDANFAQAPVIEVFQGGVAITDGQTNAVNFGVVGLGTQATVTFGVTNAGLLPLNLGGISVPAGFSVTTPPPSTLSPGQGGTFAIALDSTNLTNFGGIVSISNNDPVRNPFTFPVSGETGDVYISLSGNMAFGGLVVGSSATHTLTISNAGGAPLIVTNITYPPGYSGAFSGTIQPGTAQTVSVVFAPTQFTNYNGFLVVNGNANGGNNTLAVSGYGDTGTLELIIDISGEGTVSPPGLSGKTLPNGEAITLTATPARGWVFSNWSGTYNTNANPLKFKMAVGTLIEANFIPNPFLHSVGTYNGLFFNSNGVSLATAGMLRNFIIKTNGNYTGTLLLSGNSYPFNGTFGVNGYSTHTIKRAAAAGGPILLTLDLPTALDPTQVTGTVAGTNTNGAWSSQLVADVATNLLPSAQYTMLIPPDASNSPPQASPGGAGYVLITNYSGVKNKVTTAHAILSTALADGSTFSQTVPVSHDGYVPVYESLYAKKGLLIGWINLEGNGAAGTGLTWIYPTRTTGVYRTAFTNVIAGANLPIAAWQAPASYPIYTNLQFLPFYGAGNQYSNTPVSINSTGHIFGNGLTGTINPKTGYVTFTDGTGTNSRVGKGVVLLTSTNAGGYILSKSNSIGFSLGPGVVTNGPSSNAPNAALGYQPAP